MRLSPKSLIEAVEKLNIDHQDTTVYVQIMVEVNGNRVPITQRAESFHVWGDRLIITSKEGD